MKKIGFYGAAGTVTGSAYVLTRYDKDPVMVDMGMFQGPKEVAHLNYGELAFDPSQLIGVLLTHAHLDHCGRLPLLTRAGFHKKIYMTQPTADLLELTLMDAAHIAAHDDTKEPLFTEQDIEQVLALVEIVQYDQEFELGPYSVLYKDSGHIMGSASIQLKDNYNQDGVGTIVFSGDIGNFPQDLVQPTAFFNSADVVLMESTYGGRTHSHENASHVLQEEINIIEKQDAALLIPCFSIERTQEVLHRLDHLKSTGKIHAGTPIFLDSPMAIKATEIYKKYRSLYSKELLQHSQHDDPFEFPGLRLVEKSDESMKIHNTPGAKVIIAGSGMMTGGRIVQHAFHHLKRSTSRLLIIGYQGEGTLGRQLADGASEVEINKQMVPVHAHVRVVTSMSAHADEPKLLEWLKHIRDVRQLFLVHGDDEPREQLKNKVIELGLHNVRLPQLNEVHELTV
ncbi:MAG: Ribonuclease [Microgenomates bacterium OLB23]|nr:MAG: Ribonuclease [Microgenomates bacterium OLB23]